MGCAWGAGLYGGVKFGGKFGAVRTEVQVLLVLWDAFKNLFVKLTLPLKSPALLPPCRSW